ncbi:MAG TPA: TlpA disulfide reductase family protein [Kofleriaceae bacterium]|jgi:thiol-disulfide isomerase/thioredoxin|nr:TlpA disulfide reductase family protein [Kofleriaceae bacterium]
MRAQILLLSILCACAGASPAARPTEEATPLPALTLPRLTGDGTWEATSTRGSLLVIDVWASWCKPCGKAFPKLDALAARRSDIVIVAISIDEDAAAARDFVAQFPVHVPVIQDSGQVVTRPPLGVARLPTLLIVDKTGVIRRRLQEPKESDYEHLEELVDSIR